MSLKVSFIFCIIGALWSSVSPKNITSYGHWAVDAESCLSGGWNIHTIDAKIQDRRINELPYDIFNEDTVITVKGTFEFWMGGAPLDKKFNELRLQHLAYRGDFQVYHINISEGSARTFSSQVVHAFICLTIHRNGHCELTHRAAASSKGSLYCSTVKSHIDSITVVT